MRVSIIIPAYNEESCIAGTLNHVLAFASTFAAIREVIVVSDGSTDNTARIVEEIAERRDAGTAAIRLVCNPRNMGKGAAVRRGVLAATGDVVLFTDADLSAPMSEAPLLLDPIAQGRYDVTIGSRALDRHSIGVHQGPFREKAGRIFNFLVRAVTGMPFRDTQCGFKAFRRDALLPILQKQRIEGFAFDVELLFHAGRAGLRIAEIPVRWNHVHHSKVHMLRDPLRMFLDVVRIRLRVAFRR